MDNTEFYRRIWEILDRRYCRKAMPTEQFLPPDVLDRQLDIAIPTQGIDIDTLLGKLETLLTYTPNTRQPGYMTTLFGGRVEAAYAGKLVTAIANNAMHTYKAAGSQILVEHAVMAFMLELADFPHGEGSMTPGGTASNFIAMKLAREHAAPGAEMHGWDGRRYRAYTSAASHYAIKAAAGNIGLGEHNLVNVPVTANGKMDVRALAECIHADRQAGFLPFYLNATVGTSVLGAIDPVAEMASVARRENLWLHLDAAFGGSLLLNQGMRDRIGCVHAASVSWDAHKMMGIPLTCSVLLVRERGWLDKAFQAPAQGDYLFQTYQEYNPGRNSNQCARTNDALPLWMALQHLGRDGYEARTERQLALARYAAGRIIEHPDMVLYIKPETINVCFRSRHLDSKTVCRILDEAHGIKLSFAQLDQHNYIRLVCVNPDMDETFIDDLMDRIHRIAIGKSS
uniref:Sulfinoalanine decarboxylase/sulfinoalanine decarboxylase / aspartate 1-decarboxylase n=1 Tax=Candidatus Kentrum sp. MB TaxID=2138164 RepID=A0A450XF24_9GAMM|nr:MAG: sulfinoalanine decarboxylase/sulfinoalanine decarboxylase / aspartate 1-decarboxylase [Candidatus Kentron sp. MB]VFK27902.1 MAG: sulfinoalanine decarboxylase/sulfinoalanine decarboxylase / aspartate 1-decarboxylase [Candidatus Kentron sp. MB]VFK74457.1 MAG: sulfinoalanine decarboxylase/sulfinoalanine decarboxylase / aspartate 1-decarboxylase [Candidatus Kentron sp. MB]